MNIEVSIDIILIDSIIGLLTTRKDINLLFDKKHDKSLKKIVTRKYGTQQGKNGFVVAQITDQDVRFSIYILACEIFLKG